MHRRQFVVASTATIALASGFSAASRSAAVPAQKGSAPSALKGRIKHSICRWCYGGLQLDELCKQAAAMGISSVELLDPPEWSVPKKYGLTCAVANGPGPIHKGWNRLEHHDELVAKAEALLPQVKDAGLPNTIVFSGNRAGQHDEEGVENCVKGLKRIAPLAEKLGVTVLLEFLNSKVDHGDYQFDHMSFGLAVVKAVGSERLKILYDIYHAQIMEGDVIRTIRDHVASIGHFHTGGVPGRNEIDGGQELNYTAICRAIADAGFKGFVAQEFIPSRDPMTSLREAIAICDV